MMMGAMVGNISSSVKSIELIPIFSILSNFQMTSTKRSPQSSKNARYTGSDCENERDILLSAKSCDVG